MTFSENAKLASSIGLSKPIANHEEKAAEADEQIEQMERRKGGVSAQSKSIKGNVSAVINDIKGNNGERVLRRPAMTHLSPWIDDAIEKIRKETGKSRSAIIEILCAKALGGDIT